LNDRQRHIALTRLELNQVKQDFKHATVKETLKAMMDWKILVV
jgi:hypothetical protein